MKISVLVFFISFVSIFAQEQQDSTFINEPLKKDSLCFKYNFKQGDLLKYLVVAHDSIMIDYDKPLIKSRTQELEIRVDSVLKNGHFLLNYKITSAKSIESHGEETDIVKTSHPMVNKEIKFEIDSLGKRYSSIFLSASEALVGPGGAFEPNLIFNLAESCKAINESWIDESKDTLVENSNPGSVIDQMTLFRLKGTIDTLGDKAIRIDLMRSSKGKFRYVEGNQIYAIKNAINQWGLFDISTTKMVPIHYYSTCEQKLKISLGNGEPYKEGKHYITIFYTLIDYSNIQAKNKPLQKANLPKKKIKKK